MNFFQNLDEIERGFDKFADDLLNISIDLSKKSQELSDEINKVRLQFIMVTKDFLERNGKLNLGIIGQVKTGRSTFLNTLLFDGNTILPKAITPKTSTVTKIMYSTKNHIEIEFYNKEELQNIKNYNLDISINKENIYNKTSLNINNFIGKKPMVINIDSDFGFEKVLNDYVGENGKYTEIVKSITIFIKKNALKNLCIIDTPGLNDPDTDRTAKTKEFLEQCDIVFFLSRSSQFLDKTDQELLIKILPEKGIKKLVLIGSRFDDGINDMLLDYNNLFETYIKTKEKLTETCKYIFDNIIDDFKRKGESEELIDLIRSLKKPIFISSIVNNMSKKDINDFKNSEKIIFNNLNYYGDLTPEMLEKIGDFDDVNRVFLSTVRQKESTLKKRLDSFIPTTTLKAKNIFIEYKHKFKKRIEILTNNDKEDLNIQKKFILNQTKNLKQNIDILFSNLNNIIDIGFNKTINQLEELKKSIDYDIVEEKINRETIVQKAIFSSSKWFNPFTWTKKDEIDISFVEEYSYIDVDIAIEKLDKLSQDYKIVVDNFIKSCIKLEFLHQSFIDIVLSSLDSSSENYDPIFYKLIINNTINKISFPKIELDITEFINTISDRFCGEIKNTSDKESLKILLNYSVDTFYKDAEIKFISLIDFLKKSLDNIKTTFYVSLYENISNEFNILLEQIDNRYYEIDNYYRIINLIDMNLEFLSVNNN